MRQILVSIRRVPPEDYRPRSEEQRRNLETREPARWLSYLVGAWRFELQTSCAQGRRATRLRYAPT
jgi:hypothetical protein